MLMSPIVYFYQRQALVEVLTKFHMWKLRFMGCVHPPLNHVCIQSSECEGLNHGSNFQKSLKKG